MTESSGNLKKYRSLNPLKHFLVQQFLCKARSLFQLVPPGPLCEAGCGEGFVLKDFFDHGLLEGRPVMGLDIRQEALRFASMRVSFLNASVYELPLNNKECRCVMILEVLEHLEDPARALREAARVADFLLISVPREPFFRVSNFLSGKNWFRREKYREHVQSFGERSFKKLLEPYGEILRFEKPFPWLMALLKTR